MPTVKFIILLVPLLVLGACAGNPDASDGGHGVVDLTQEHESSWTHPGYLNAKTLELLPQPHQPAVDEMLVPGRIIGSYFHPSGDLLGNLQSAPAGELSVEAWLILTDRSLHYPGEGREAPTQPYLEGRFDPEASLFYPSSKTVRNPAPPAAEPAEPR